LALGFLHGVRGEFTEDVSETAADPSSLFMKIRPVKMGPTAAPETSSVNSPRTLVSICVFIEACILSDGIPLFVGLFNNSVSPFLVLCVT
jgi:hypothetical protein